MKWQKYVTLPKPILRLEQIFRSSHKFSQFIYFQKEIENPF